MTSRVLITGASGFLGRALGTWLHDRDGVQVEALVRGRLSATASDRFHAVHNIDIRRPFRLDSDPYDLVFHLAGLNTTTIGAGQDEEYRMANVQGTAHVLDAVSARGFVFVSTARVYRQGGSPLDEDAPLEPAPGYAASKLEAESLCRERFAGEQLTVLRPTNIVGPGQRRKALVSRFFERALAGRHLELLVPGSTRLQLLDVSDVLELFGAILAAGGLAGTFNVAPVDSISIAELAREIVSLCGSSSQVLCRETATDEVPFSEVRADALSERLSWRATVTTPRILARIYRHSRR